ncbi:MULTISPECIES: alpha/beta fold hydrolase [unclassified Novosphingobium]|uniref:alpha/beta fold hydrolase n=1 Tax=unclassified Novosphingobium TaxID=2644732 RepID=UPI0013569532|nr:MULTISPECIES: alpha/beta fold hydrolase [unclassified Novosphingobium]
MLVNIDGRDLRYDILGDEAAPVVCLAHALSSDSGIWAEQVPSLLAAGWRVLRPDMRGHGGSEAGVDDYAMSALTQDIVGILDFLGIDKVHFVGLSIGGMIGQTFAIEHPERLRSLMLCGTAPAALEGGMDVLWKPRFAAIAAAGSVAPLADATMPRWFTEAFRERRPDRVQQIYQTVCRTTPAGYRGGGIAIDTFDVRDQLHSITMPTLVLCGDGDTGTPPSGNRAIANAIPGARYVELENARHIPMVEYPELFSSILLDWLAAHR